MSLLMAPFAILGWIIKHPRILVVVLVIGFIFVGIRSCTGAFSSGVNSKTLVSNAADYQNVSQTSVQAPFVISTGTRVYYVKTYTDKNDIVTLNGYFTYDKNTWQFHSTPLFMDRKYYGLITIAKREGT